MRLIGGPYRQSGTGARELLLRARIPITLVTLAGVVSLVLAVVNRNLTFLVDDWIVLAGRHGFSADTYLRPHNEHLSAVPIAIYQVLRFVFGTSSYIPYQLTALAAHLSVCGMVWKLSERHVGPWAALAPAVILSLLGPASDDLLWAFQLGYFLSITFGLGAWLLLDRPASTRRDVAASALITLSLASASIGVGVLVGCFVMQALSGKGIRRLWVTVVPATLYGLWYVGYGTPAPSVNWVQVPGYIADSLSAALASISGLSQPRPGVGQPSLVDLSYGRTLAVAYLALLGWVVIGRSTLHGRNLLLAGNSTAATLWFLVALEVNPLRTPESSRYQYFGATFLLLALVGLAPRRLRRRAGIALVALTGFVLLANVLILHDRSVGAEATAVITRGDFGALEISRPAVRPDFVSADLFVVPISAGSYFALADAHGTVAYSEDQLASASGVVRARADALLVDAERLAGRSIGSGTEATECSASRTFEVGTGQYLIRSPDSAPVLTAARFGDLPGARISAPVGTSVLTIPRDASKRPWRVTLAGPSSSRFCRVA